MYDKPVLAWLISQAMGRQQDKTTIIKLKVEFVE